VSRGYKPLVTIATSSPNDPDLLIIDIREGNSKIQLLNIYNKADQAGLGPYTLERCLFPRELDPNSIILGDFNTHHPWWDPLNRASPRAVDLVHWLEARNLLLVNTPGTSTFFRPNLERPSVLDLTFVSNTIANRVEDWQTLPDLGSNHLGILFSV